MLEISFPNLSLKIEKGSCLLITGKNASGKSKLLKALAGLEKPQEGKVLLDGRNIYTLAKDEKKKFLDFTGVALHEASLNPYTRVAHKLVKEMSAGEKKIADLKRSLQKNPRLMFWDEPFLNLDQASRHFIQEELARLKSQGTTIIISTLSSDDFHFLNPEKILTLPHGA